MSDDAKVEWNPVSTIPCDDTWAVVKYWDGGTEYQDVDHDSTPQWWAERGVTHWRLPTAEETDEFWRKLS